MLNGCDENTTPNNLVNYSGTITLEDETDHGGATVSLYKPVELDTALVRINQQYPNIGVQISQQTEFDHREHEPVYTTETNADGSWEIDKVQPGEYNVVVEKDSFGHFTGYNLSEQEVKNINLDHIYFINGIVDNDLIFPENSFINLENVRILQGTKIVVGENSTIFIEPATSVQVEGKFEINGELNYPVKIISEKGQFWNSINFASSATGRFSYCVFSDVKKPIYTKSGEISFNNSIFNEMDLGIDIFDVSDSLNISGNIFTKCIKGIFSDNSNKIKISNNIFLNNEYSIEYVRGNEYHIIENLFSNDENNIHVLNSKRNYQSILRVLQCNFENSYNNVLIFDQIFTEINYNNFINTENYFVIVQSEPDIGTETLDFTENFWNRFQVNDIKQKISDVEDSGNPKGYIVDVSNFLVTRYAP